jgi:hypothetical protein
VIGTKCVFKNKQG